MRILVKILFYQSWVLFILITCINTLVLKSRSRQYILANADLEGGYKKMFKGLMFYGNIPWLIMGIGNLTGLTKSTFDYLTPRQLNPIVLIFHFAIIILWIVSIRWIYFKNGAEFLERHPGLLRVGQTAKQVKIFFPLMLLGGIIGMVMMWVMDPSIPNIHF